MRSDSFLIVFNNFKKIGGSIDFFFTLITVLTLLIHFNMNIWLIDFIFAASVIKTTQIISHELSC